jgi:hypothetical protein
MCDFAIARFIAICVFAGTHTRKQSWCLRVPSIQLVKCFIFTNRHVSGFITMLVSDAARDTLRLAL